MSEAEHDAADDLNQLMSNWRRLTSPTTNENTQTVIHQGLGAWGPAAIVACFATLMGLVVVTVIITHENDKLARRIETLEAWNGVNNNVITKMQSTIEYLNREKK